MPSRFLFDERIFDKTYFREMMCESRARAKKKREEIERLLAESRSGALSLTEDPNLEAIPGLFQDLNEFVGAGSAQMLGLAINTDSGFRMEDYRKHILSLLDSGLPLLPLTRFSLVVINCFLLRVQRCPALNDTTGLVF